MKKITFLFLLLMPLLLVNCTEDDDLGTTEDTRPQGISDVRWVGHPSLDRLEGPIMNGGNYTLSLATGFQLNIDMRGEFAFGEAFYLVNDDSTIREDIVTSNVISGSYDGSISYISRVDQIPLGEGEFYTVEPGDVYHFYYTFIDVDDMTYSGSWTANIVE